MRSNAGSEHYTIQAWKHLDQLTKPPRSLGRIEEVAATLCGIQKNHIPQTKPRSVIVFAGDHGISEEGVSAFPQAVTVDMLKNMAAGGAAVSVLARLHQCSLRVVDMGSKLPIHQTIPGVERRVVRNGTRNFFKEPAMTVDEMQKAVQTGKDIVQEEIKNGTRLLIFGEMGIGNTTSTAALTAALLKESTGEITGRGTGLDDAGLQHKIHVIQQALDLHHHRLSGTESVLICFGGYETAAMTGAIVEAAEQNIPVLLDGFTVSAAAFIASRWQPLVLSGLIASHLSAERGHQRILQSLNLQPLLDLSLRLGEASGALIALPLLDAAAAVYSGMATFESSGVGTA